MKFSSSRKTGFRKFAPIYAEFVGHHPVTDSIRIDSNTTSCACFPIASDDDCYFLELALLSSRVSSKPRRAMLSIWSRSAKLRISFYLSPVFYPSGYDYKRKNSRSIHQHISHCQLPMATYITMIRSAFTGAPLDIPMENLIITFSSTILQSSGLVRVYFMRRERKAVKFAMSDSPISLSNVALDYPRVRKGVGFLRGIITGRFNNQPSKKKWFRALDGINLDVNKGEVVGIIGPNAGSGKSTLLRVIAGIYAPDEGSIEVEGRIHPSRRCWHWI